MLVPVDEWEEAKAWAEQIQKINEPADNGQRVAEEFMKHFDVLRSDDWGHIAYCLAQANHLMWRQAHGDL